MKAIACERVAETGEPLSRQSLADLTRRINESFRVPMSRSTVWRILHEEAIKPWQHESWLYPRDPRFVEKAGPILELYAGRWEGKPLGPKDYVLSSDEKTSIQARKRRHEETPPRPRQTRRIESEYKRCGALQYLAVWDVRRGLIMGRCEAKTGIAPFGRLLDQMLDRSPYREAERLFCCPSKPDCARPKSQNWNGPWSSTPTGASPTRWPLKIVSQKRNRDGAFRSTLNSN